MNSKLSVNRRLIKFEILTLTLVLLLTLANNLRADTGACNGGNVTVPFLDVAGNPFFCSIAAAYFSGLTNGTSPTTYSPNDVVTREQMAAFISRTLNQSLKRGSRRAALRQWWKPQRIPETAKTILGGDLFAVESDGADLWVADFPNGKVMRVRGSDGKLLGTWTGADHPRALLVAEGRIYGTGGSYPGQLFAIDPEQAPGNVISLATVEGTPVSLAFDGSRIWIGGSGGHIFDPQTAIVNPIPAGICPLGFAYDGTNMWATGGCSPEGKLFKLDSSGNVLQTINIGKSPRYPLFDGANIWVPYGVDQLGGQAALAVVRASTGTVVATLTGNGLGQSAGTMAFDGERILVPNYYGSLSLWRAADLAPLGTFSVGPGDVHGTCSDGVNFWVTLGSSGKLGRF